MSTQKQRVLNGLEFSTKLNGKLLTMLVYE
jgi:hypothetical protein